MKPPESSSVQDRLDRAHWRVEGRLATAVSWIAFAIALVIAIAGPAGYFGLSWQANGREAEIAARLYAAFVNQAIGATQDDEEDGWRNQVDGLLDADLAPSGLPERRMIVDLADHRLVEALGADGRRPSGFAAAALERRAPLFASGVRVGEVVVVRDLGPEIQRALLVALASAALGVAVYGACAALPMRSLRRTLAALRDKEAEGRREAEEHLRVVFDNAIEGIMMLGPDGRVISGNPAAARIFGLPSPDGLAGRDAATLIGALPGATDGDPLPVGQAEAEARRADGTPFPIDITLSESRGEGEGSRIAILRDITERKQAEARLSHLASYDDLTGLPNRTRFRERLAQAMTRAAETGLPFALMFLDLDRFKTINDSLGHDVGDRLLQLVAQALGRCVEAASREIDVAPGVVSRLGGDEFTVLVESLYIPEDVERLARRVLQALSVPFVVGKDELFISASIGITYYLNSDCDLDALIKQADIAMYRSKDLGRNTYYVYNDELDAAATERLLLETALRHAIERDEFSLHYQPKVDALTGRPTGVEALLRWRPTGGKPIGPDRFIPILEETGMIAHVGAWVLREACGQMVRWIDAGLAPIGLAVNLSARQFRQTDLIEMIAATLAESGLPPALLEIELTESMLVDNIDEVVRIMQRLGAMGISLAIDDFGTGHSSLSYLKRFDLDTLKIDRSFVRDTPDDPDDNAIATAVIALAHGLGLRVVAEGVETERQFDFLRGRGCDHIQGYLLSPPLPSAEAFAWLRARQQGQEGDQGAARDREAAADRPDAGALAVPAGRDVLQGA